MECQPQTSKSARHRNCRVKLKDDHPSRPLPASELPSHIASPTALNLPCSPPHSHSVLAYRKVYQANTACTFSALHRSHCACLSLRRIPTTEPQAWGSPTVIYWNVWLKYLELVNQGARAQFAVVCTPIFTGRSLYQITHWPKFDAFDSCCRCKKLELCKKREWKDPPSGQGSNLGQFPMWKRAKR